MLTAATDKAPTVLLVDDCDDARTALGWLLQAHGFRVLDAATGRDALRLAGREPDLVVLDVVLPDLDGFEVCRRLKADPDTALTPVLMVSGQAVSDEDRVHGLDGGADAYLTKPAEPAVLLAHAHALLRVRRAELELHRSREQYRALADSIPLLVWACRPDGTIEHASRRWREYGDPPRGRLATAWERLAHPDDRPRLLSRWADALRTGEPFEAEYRLRRADGQYRWHVGRATPQWGAGGRVARWFGTSTDIEPQRRAEDRSRQAQKMEAVGRLAGGVAHDFNNLLTVIGGYGEVVLGQLAPGTPQREMVGEMVRAGERAAALTRQLLAFGRKAVVAPERLDVNAVVRDVERLVRRVVGEDVDLAARLRPGLGPVIADPGQLEQVVMNLVVNARDAMPRGGKLTIETGEADLGEEYAAARPGVRPGRYVQLSVTDTGTGIPADVLPHVFEPFFTTKEAGRGTGLGLATVHGIVRQAGGHVDVYSEVGVGTTFKVYLPRADGAAPAAAGAAVAPPPRGSETVLLAEDEDGVRALAGLVLRDAGYAVLESHSGDDALGVAGRWAGPVHLLVTDVVMPGMGGRELAERLAAGRPGLKVLYLSGYTDDAVVRHGVLEEHVHFLQKPFTPAGLARKVREVLDAGG